MCLFNLQYKRLPGKLMPPTHPCRTHKETKTSGKTQILVSLTFFFLFFTYQKKNVTIQHTCQPQTLNNAIQPLLNFLFLFSSWLISFECIIKEARRNPFENAYRILNCLTFFSRHFYYFW